MLPTKVRDHFNSVDPILSSLIPLSDNIAIQHSENYFLSLCREIITQQLAGGAARAIFGRFEKLFTTETVTAEKILLIPDQIIRDTGASWAKVKYIKSLAQCVVSKIIHLNKLNELSDAEVIEELVKVKGIGPWTAEMFLMFSLGREDVFSFGDLGLRHSLQKLYKMKKEPTVKQMEKITSKWSPYRTYGALLLWKSLDNEK
ncbi:MAG: hypothetical protein ACD_48C00323G0001 [uncultured bacterium]|nr:MAG: hypothetical protein ACD_48C00323G0001 [uncultured bacterium]